MLSHMGPHTIFVIRQAIFSDMAMIETIIFMIVDILFFLLPLFRLRQKKEGAIPCRSPGEAVGCPVRTTERRCAHGAHSPLRLGSYRSNFLHFTRAKTMRRTQSLELSGAHYSRFPPRCGRQSEKNSPELATPPLLPRKGQSCPHLILPRCGRISRGNLEKLHYHLRTKHSVGLVIKTRINISRKVRKAREV